MNAAIKRIHYTLAIYSSSIGGQYELGPG